MIQSITLLVQSGLWWSTIPFSYYYTHWHVSRVVYKWWHLADCKLLQFIKQQKNIFVNKCVRVTNFSTEKQQMELVVCHSVYQSQKTVDMLEFVFVLYTFCGDFHFSSTTGLIGVGWSLLKRPKKVFSITFCSFFGQLQLWIAIFFYPNCRIFFEKKRSSSLRSELMILVMSQTMERKNFKLQIFKTPFFLPRLSSQTYKIMKWLFMLPQPLTVTIFNTHPFTI